MPLFKRKDKTTIAELEEYYANQNNNRNGKAWFMALLSLIITLAVLAGLFFGGRWLYRLVTDDGSVEVNTTGEQSGSLQGEVPSFGEIRTDSNDDAGSDSQSDDSTDSSATNNDSATNNGDSEGVVSDEAATTTRDVAGTNSDSDNTDTADETSSEENSDSDETIVSTTDIPNTGANELFFALPFVAAVVGYFVSRKNQLAKK